MPLPQSVIGEQGGSLQLSVRGPCPEMQIECRLITDLSLGVVEYSSTACALPLAAALRITLLHFRMTFRMLPLRGAPEMEGL